MPAFPASSAPTTDAQAAVLKRVYLDGVRSAVNTDTILMDMTDRVPDHRFIGEKVYLTVKSQLPITQVIGDAGNGDTLPPASRSKDTSVSYDIKEVACRLGWSAMGLDRTRRAPEGALVDVLEDEMMAARDSFNLEMNRQMMSDSSGVLATLTSAITDATAVQVGATRFLHDGDPIVLVNASAGTDAPGGANNTIVAVLSGTLIEVAAAATAGTVDGIVKRSGSTGALHNTDMYGLDAIIATTNPGAGNLGGINRTTSGNLFWKSSVLTNSTLRPVTPDLLAQSLNVSERRAGTKKGLTRIGITSDGVMTEYGALLASDKRYPANFVKLDGGWKALDFAGTPIVWDKDAPANTLFWVVLEHLMVAEMREISFENRMGSEFFQVADKHQFQSLLYGYYNLIATQCHGHVKLAALRENNATHNLY